MALNQISYPQPTGLQQLGDVLLKGSGDYANIQLQRQAEDRRRAQALADLQDQRRYQEGQRGILRSEAIDDATLNILIKEGWLKPTDARNPQAVQMAADARQAQLAKAQGREAQLPERLQREADYLGEQDIQLAQVEAQLNAKLSEPEPGPPSPQEVRIVAERMTNKPAPSEQEVAEMIPAATQAIMRDRFLRWTMEKEDAKTQIPLLRSQRTALRQSLSGLLQQGFTPNRPPPAPAAVLSSPVARTSGGDPLAAFKAARAGGVAAPAVSSPAAALSFPEISAVQRTAPQSMQVPLRQAGTQVLAQDYERLDQPAMDTRAKIAEVQNQIQRVQSGLNPFQTVTPAPLPNNPQVQGELMARLLMQLTPLQRQLQQEEQARSQGKRQLLQNLRPATPAPTPAFQSPTPSPAATLNLPPLPRLQPWQPSYGMPGT